MSWFGLAKGKGLGQKKIYVKTLTFGTATADNISSLIYPGRPGLLVTIPELEKVDFALVQVLSCAQDQSGFSFAKVAAYSGNQFTVNFASTSVLSGTVFAPDHVSGLNVSGIVQLQALVIGEGRKEAA